MSVPSEKMTAKPDTTISLGDFVDKAGEEGCIIIKKKKEMFIGEPGSSTGLAYPHIHIWIDGTIALSISSTKNIKVGNNESIDITLLYGALERYKIGAGRLRNTIGWVFASAS